MAFYQACLGGELSLQTVGETPMADKLPPKMKESILHATLVKGSLTLMASDMVGEKGLIKGNAVSLMLDCSSEEEIRSCYAALAQGGEATHPLELSFWGALFGDLTDQFGNHWLLHFEKRAPPVADQPTRHWQNPPNGPWLCRHPHVGRLVPATYGSGPCCLHGIGNNALVKIKKKRCGERSFLP